MILGDFQRFYHLNLVEVLADGSGYSPRHVVCLIRQLPMESATVAALRGGSEYLGWDIDRYFMANILDAINYNTHVTILAAGPKKRPTPPEPVYRPDNNARARNKPKKTNMFAKMAAQQLLAAKRK